MAGKTAWMPCIHTHITQQTHWCVVAQGQDMHWWQVLLLDVAAVYALGALVASQLALALLWLLKKPAGPPAQALQRDGLVGSRAMQPEEPGTPSPPQSPVHSSAGYKSGKDE
jgi:hypothetical protein